MYCQIKTIETMAYRSNHIQAFIDKVKLEAEAAAQAIFDANNAKLQEMINNQVLPNQKLLIGMGTAFISDPNRDLPYDYAQNFLTTVAETQYHKDNVCAGFNIDDCDKI